MSFGLDCLAQASRQDRDVFISELSAEERSEFPYHWRLFARPEQIAPPGDWRIWLVMAGRGFGKTRCGAEWIRETAENQNAARIALVSASLAEARAVMVEGESGIMACSPPDRRPHFEPSLKRLKWPNGAQAQLFSASEPEALRGPQHSHAWCDEIGKWPLSGERATRCWDNLMMGLRVSSRPQIAVTTTPRSVPLLTRLLDQVGSGSATLSKGSTFDNAINLPERFIEAMQQDYGGTQLSRQEIDGELLDDIKGALWTRALIEASRETETVPAPRRVVVAVDPPATAHGDECGIVVAALGSDNICRIMADCSIANAAPDGWARAVAGAASNWCADKVVAEANQGGAMVESVLRAADVNLPVKLVHASRGKSARAEPVAALYAAGRVRHCGSFAHIEDQLCGLLIGGDYAGPNESPDRADALVWAVTELMLGRATSPSVHII